MKIEEPDAVKCDRHHYIPRFYLKRWNYNDSLTEFSQPHGSKIVAKGKATKATGYKDRLYEMPRVPAESRSELETGHFRALDTAASLVLDQLEADPSALTEADKKAWSDFILSLLYRSEDDFPLLIDTIKREWGNTTPELEARYKNEFRREDQPETLAEFLQQTSLSDIEKHLLIMVPEIMANTQTPAFFAGMRWFVLDTSEARKELMTSDKPVTICSDLRKEDAFVMLPIGPNSLFFAVHNWATEQDVRSWPPKKWVKYNNEAVSGRAMRYVYATSEKPLKCIQRTFGSLRSPSLVERLADRRNQPLLS